MRLGQAAMLGLAMTVMIQRVGLLDLTSMTERTSPVTGDPSTVTVVFLAAMLMIAAASRDFSIGRIKCLHVDQAAERETVPQ